MKVSKKANVSEVSLLVANSLQVNHHCHVHLHRYEDPVVLEVELGQEANVEATNHR